MSEAKQRHQARDRSVETKGKDERRPTKDEGRERRTKALAHPEPEPKEEPKKQDASHTVDDSFPAQRRRSIIMFKMRHISAVCVVAVFAVPNVASFQYQQPQRARGDIPSRVETLSVSPQLHVAEGSLMHISSHRPHHSVSAAQSRLFRRRLSRTSRHLVTLSVSSASAPTAGIVHPSSHSAYDKKGNDKHEYIGTKYLSGNPVMDKIDQIERDMSKNQAEAHEMIEALRNDLKIQRILRHESEMAMDRLAEIKTDMVMRLNQMREHYEDDRRALVRESNRQLVVRDEKIEAYENELGSVRCLVKRLVGVLVSKFLRLGERLTRRFAKEKAAATHALLE